ncbi:MAG: hypothetical protein QFF03_15180 [Pseudomonadota bacterium]|nr:hypothetical protein [Pseudomonadota bacterium]
MPALTPGAPRGSVPAFAHELIGVRAVIALAMPISPIERRSRRIVIDEPVYECRH